MTSCGEFEGAPHLDHLSKVMDFEFRVPERNMGESIDQRNITNFFVPGPPTNTQFLVKDSKKYASTGGWGFGHFSKDGTLGTDAQLKTCFPCHAKASLDFVFTRYAP